MAGKLRKIDLKMLDADILSLINNKRNASESYTKDETNALFDSITQLSSDNIAALNNIGTLTPENIRAIQDLSTLQSNVDNKVDKVTGKALSTNDYTTDEKTKLTGLQNYTHPATHPASVIVQDSSNRLVTDTEKATWTGKADGNHNHNTSYAALSHLHEIANVNGLSDYFTKIFVGSNSRGSKYATDINGILQSGFYYSVDIVNNPIPSNGFIIHNQFSEHDNYAMQIYVPFNSNSFYIRRKLTGVWQTWLDLTPQEGSKWLRNGFTNSQADVSTFDIGVAFNVLKDDIHLYINGLKAIKGKHYTLYNNNTQIYLLNSFRLKANDDVLIEVLTNSI